ncbi:MAG: hypothetical protein ABSH34_01320 [Verrucomicrobiota bacterium]
MKRLPARGPVLGGSHLIAGANQDLGVDPADGPVVLDQEDAPGRLRRALP